jgi:uncharacterized glyoxalase superfamily protein PhnB
MSATDITDKHALHGVQAVLFVPDVAKTLMYYRDSLGFHVDFEVGDPPVHARVYSGDPMHSSAARIRFEKTAATAIKEPSCYLYVHVGENIDELHRAFVARGLDVLGEPSDKPWGLRVFELRDLNGYVLLFAQEIEATD